MKKLYRIISSILLVCFLLNTCVYSQPTTYPYSGYMNTAKLAVPSFFSELVGLEHKDMGRIKIGLEATLLHELKDIEDDLLREFTLSDVKSWLRVKRREDTLFGAATMQFLFNDMSAEINQLPNGYFSVKCRIQDKKARPKKRTYFAVFKLEKEDNVFPIEVYTEEEYDFTKVREAITRSGKPPLREGEDAREIDRYSELNEKIIDKWIKARLTEKGRKFAEISGRARDLGWDKKYLGRQKPTSYWRRLVMANPRPYMDHFLGAFGISVSQAFRGKNIVFIRVPEGTLLPEIVENGKTIRVKSHASEHQVYFFLDAKSYDDLDRMDKNISGTGQMHRDLQALKNRFYKRLGSEIIHEVGAVCKLPFETIGRRKLVSDLDKAYSKYVKKTPVETLQAEFPGLKDLKVSNLDEVSGRDYSSGDGESTPGQFDELVDKSWQIAKLGDDLDANPFSQDAQTALREIVRVADEPDIDGRRISFNTYYRILCARLFTHGSNPETVNNVIDAIEKWAPELRVTDTFPRHMAQNFLNLYLMARVMDRDSVEQMFSLSPRQSFFRYYGRKLLGPYYDEFHPYTTVVETLTAGPMQVTQDDNEIILERVVLGKVHDYLDLLTGKHRDVEALRLIGCISDYYINAGAVNPDPRMRYGERRSLLDHCRNELIAASEARQEETVTRPVFDLTYEEMMRVIALSPHIRGVLKAQDYFTDFDFLTGYREVQSALRLPLIPEDAQTEDTLEVEYVDEFVSRLERLAEDKYFRMVDPETETTQYWPEDKARAQIIDIQIDAAWESTGLNDHVFSNEAYAFSDAAQKEHLPDILANDKDKLIRGEGVRVSAISYVRICYAMLFSRHDEEGAQNVIEFFDYIAGLEPEDELRLQVTLGNFTEDFMFIYYLARLMDEESMRSIRELSPPHPFFEYYAKKFFGSDEYVKKVFERPADSKVFLDPVKIWLERFIHYYYFVKKDYKRAICLIDNFTKLVENEYGVHYIEKIVYEGVMEEIRRVRRTIEKEMGGDGAVSEQDGQLSEIQARDAIDSSKPFDKVYPDRHRSQHNMRIWEIYQRFVEEIETLSDEFAAKNRGNAIPTDDIRVIPGGEHGATLVVKIIPQVDGGKIRRIAINQSYLEGLHRLGSYVTDSPHWGNEVINEVTEALMEGSVFNEFGHGWEWSSQVDLYSLLDAEDAKENYAVYAEMLGIDENLPADRKTRREFAEAIAETCLGGKGSGDYVRNKAAYLFYRYLSDTPEDFFTSETVDEQSIRDLVQRYFERNFKEYPIFEKILKTLVLHDDDLERIETKVVSYFRTFFGEGTPWHKGYQSRDRSAEEETTGGRRGTGSSREIAALIRQSITSGDSSRKKGERAEARASLARIGDAALQSVLEVMKGYGTNSEEYRKLKETKRTIEAALRRRGTSSRQDELDLTPAELKNKKTVLIVGGAGYIGSTTARSFHSVDEDHRVIIYDNLSTGHRKAVPEGIEFVEGELSDKEHLKRVMEKYNVDSVVHFAANIEVGESKQKPAKYYENNVINTMILLEAMREAGVRKIVFSSSAAVYGEPKSVPIREDADLAPITPYGVTKFLMEKLLEEYANVHGFRAVALRYFNASGADVGYGEAHDPETHIIPNFVKAVLEGRDVPMLGDGSNRRDYAHVLDLASAHQLAVKWLDKNEGVKDDAAGEGVFEAFNLGAGEMYSNREIFDTIKLLVKRITGNESPSGIEVNPPRDGDPQDLGAANDKARRELGWNPEHSGLTKIVEDAIKWHVEHPDGYKEPKKTVIEPSNLTRIRKIIKSLRDNKVVSVEFKINLLERFLKDEQNLQAQGANPVIDAITDELDYYSEVYPKMRIAETAVSEIQEIDRLMKIGAIDVSPEDLAQTMDNPIIPACNAIGDMLVSYLDLLSFMDGDYKKLADTKWRKSDIYKQLRNFSGPVSEEAFVELWQSIKERVETQRLKLKRLERVPESMRPRGRSKEMRDFKTWIKYLLTHTRMNSLKRDYASETLVPLLRFTLRSEAAYRDEVLKKQRALYKILTAEKRETERKDLESIFRHVAHLPDTGIEKLNIATDISDDVVENLVKLARVVTQNPEFSLIDLLKLGVKRRLTGKYYEYMYSTEKLEEAYVKQALGAHETIHKTVEDMSENAHETGMSIPTNDDDRYTLFVDYNLYEGDEFKDDISGYTLPNGPHIGAGDRFDLVKIDASGQYTEKVQTIIRKVVIAGVDPSKAIVQLSTRFEKKEIDKLMESCPGIRVIHVDTSKFKLDEREVSKEKRAEYRFNLYAMMLSARQITEKDIEEENSTYKTLSFFLNTHYGEGTQNIAPSYIKALVKGTPDDIIWLLSQVLSYKPAERFRIPDYNLVAATLISA